MIKIISPRFCLNSGWEFSFPIVWIFHAKDRVHVFKETHQWFLNFCSSIVCDGMEKQQSPLQLLSMTSVHNSYTRPTQKWPHAPTRERRFFCLHSCHLSYWLADVLHIIKRKRDVSLYIEIYSEYQLSIGISHASEYKNRITKTKLLIHVQNFRFVN